MRHLRPNLQIIKKYLPIIAITVLAVLLRLYLLPLRTSFDADQEEIAFKAKEIISGNPVLLGPKTSLGGFSIGPGFNYLWAIFSYLLKGDPISGAVLSTSLGVLFIILNYLILKKFFSEKTAIITSLILTVSSNLIEWDQVPWAPSLFNIAELLVFYGIYISNENINGLLIALLGLAVGFQSHFAIFLLILPVTLYLIIYKPLFNKKIIIPGILVLMFVLLPVLVFDITHGFINAQKFILIFNLGVKGEGPGLLKLFNTLITMSSNIVLSQLPKICKILFIIGTLSLISWNVVKDKDKRSWLILSILLLITPFFIFLFYKSNFSEYYLMTAVVPSVLMIGYLLSLIKRNSIMFLVVTPIVLINLRNFVLMKKPMNLYAKEQIVKEIVKIGGTNGYGVSMSGVDPRYGFGYEYLFKYYKAYPNSPPLAGQKKIFTIVSPPEYHGIVPLFELDGVGLRWEGFD